MIDSTELEIRHGERLRALLEEETVKEAMAWLDQAYFAQFRAAKTADEREVAWASAHALDDLRQRFRAVIDRGVTAKARVDAAKRR